jgi:hypothetical protein
MANSDTENQTTQTDNQPIDNQPTNNQSTNNQPIDNQPTTNQPIDNQPNQPNQTDNEPIDNQPTNNQPIDNQPTTNQPTTNQPTNNQPTNNQPIDNQPTTNQPTTNQPTNNQPIIILDNIIIEPSIKIVNEQIKIPDINVITHTTFDTLDPNAIPQIKEDLTEKIEYNYDDNIITESDNLVNEIRHYALQIKCEDFHGKGSIDDYAELFKAASKIANETKQMQLDIDIDGFNEFSKAADDLSELFANFTKRLQNINIINDVKFLQAVLNALKKIWNLSEVFGKFKNTILVTSEIKVPKTAHDTKNILVGVMDEINCAMNYVNNFVVVNPNLPSAQLSFNDKNIINKAVSTIENWQTLCDQGVSIALSNSSDMNYLKNTNSELKLKTSILETVTSTLKSKLASYGYY